MKIKLSKSQWEGIGKKAGWMKTSASAWEEKQYMHIGAPGSLERVKVQYPRLIARLEDLKSKGGDLTNAYDQISAAGIRVPSIEAESLLEVSGFKQAAKDSDISRRRYVRVTFNDGDTMETGINGTKKEVEDYYLKNEFVKGDEKTMHRGIKVEFLD